MANSMSPVFNLDPFSRDALEFAGVVELVRGFLSGQISQPLVDTLAPGTDLGLIRRDLARAGEARDALREGERPGLAWLKDPRPIFQKLGIEGMVCTAFEILALVDVARAARDVRNLFAKTPYTRLDLLAGGVADFRDLVAQLAGKILPDGSMDSSASPELARIRRQSERLRQETEATLERLLRRLGHDQVLQDAVVTIRNDRFVLPVRAEEKRRVDGIVHGASSSGATLFIEPMETVPLNNELVEMQDREFAEIQRILAEFTEKLRARRDDLEHATEILSELDLAFAKAEFARQYECCLPEFIEPVSGSPQQERQEDERFTTEGTAPSLAATEEDLNAEAAEAQRVPFSQNPVGTVADALSFDRRNEEPISTSTEQHGTAPRDRSSPRLRVSADSALSSYSSAPSGGERGSGLRELMLADVRHPLLQKALRAQHQQPVPLTITLREPKTLLLISGPNTGGKTVALKTAGLAVLMAQAGLPVAAGYARLPLFQRVLADIGDQQSIEANLSTFSAHVRNIQAMARVADRDSLVLIDEIGSSTDPTEGAALAVAVLEHFRERGTMSIVTTHHSRLKAYAAESPAALNAAMEFDEATLQPTYRLLIGLPGKSSGLDIAQRLGLEPSIVAKARSLIDPAEAEAAALVATLHEQKAELERETGRLRDREKEVEQQAVEREQKFERERRAKLRDLDRRLEETLKRNEEKWEKTIAEIRAEIQRLGQSVKSARGLDRQATRLVSATREDWNAEVLESLGQPGSTEDAVTAAPPAVGDRVRVANVATPGVVTALVGNDGIEVQVGVLRMRLSNDEVRVLTRAAPAKPSKAGTSTASSSGHAGQAPSVPSAASRETSVGAETSALSAAVRASLRSNFSMDREVEAPAEINVIGTTAEEAQEQVDKFLDQAFLAGRSSLRVIHGHGKGILRRSLHEMFASHPHVERFYPAPPNEGGTGATIVELKT